MAWVMLDEHEPVVGEQHESVGGWAHRFGEHAPWPSVNTLGEPQPLAMATVQKPVAGEQHEPDPGQVLGKHTPFWAQVAGELQLTWMTPEEQKPLVGEQHVPVGGWAQGFGKHAP